MTMTAAEFKTLRESCGLSVDRLAGILPRPVRLRTVQRWEAGDLPVPDDAADYLRRLDAKLTDVALHAAEVIAKAPKGTILHLVRYRSAKDLEHYRPDMADLGPLAHAALVDRVRQAAGRLGYEVRIVFLDPGSYEAWRAETGHPDDDQTRAEWAGLQLDE